VRTYYPRQFDFLVSLVISLLCGGLIIVSLYLKVDSRPVLIAGITLICFACVFLLLKVTGGRQNENTPNTISVNFKEKDAGDVALEVDKLRSLEKYRKEFLGNVSHELKTPVFNIQGYILTLLDGGLEDPVINREYLKRTEKSINRMINIIDDLESITKLETGELELEFENFNIHRLVRDVFEFQDANRNRYKIKLIFDKNYQKPIMVYADEKRITEVLNNLIVNSIYYSERGGKTTVGFIEQEENILVDVRDNGIGIAKNEIPRIFERFYRTDRSRSRDRGGTGLGLSIVKHIIEAHNQSISVKSEPGQGSSFSFTLKKA